MNAVLAILLASAAFMLHADPIESVSNPYGRHGLMTLESSEPVSNTIVFTIL